MLSSPIPHIPFSYADLHRCVVVSEDGSVTVFYEQNKLTSHTLLELRRHLRCDFSLVALEADDFSKKLTDNYQQRTDSSHAFMQALHDNDGLNALLLHMPKASDLLAAQDDAPIVRLINAILSEAIARRASDIHIETFQHALSIRLRTDGLLQDMLSPHRSLAPLVVSRIKIMAKLDIAEKRLPQDGRISLLIGGADIDLRVSTLPTHHGERIVLRILDKKAVALDLAQLGLAPDHLALMHQLIHKPHGILLLTGPTGSGKTTTLYAALSALDTKAHNIMTVEDPIEFDLPGVGQTQVNNKIGLDFARGLRAILRQDPDIVMVGEIRDKETVDMAVQASLTGHLVLATLHANTPIGAITRLRDMGVESFLVGASLVGVLAQRLVRLLCPSCRRATQASIKSCFLLGVSTDCPPTIYEPQGCDACHNGYQGRTAIYEIIPIDDTLRALIHRDATEAEIRQAVETTHRRLSEDGARLVLAGKTSCEEILRVTES